MKRNVVRVVLADDNDAIRAGIKRLLSKAQDIEVVGEANNGIEVLQLVRHLQPDVLLLDVEMPLLNGVEVARQLKDDAVDVPILVLSAHANKEYIRKMLENGASGYLIKDEAPEQILPAVRGIAQGETQWISPQVRARLDRR